MKLLFNNGNKGQEEIKKVLGFLDGGFSYDNLEPDIILNTPYLIDLVGQEVYDKITDHYDTDVNTPAALVDALNTATTYMRLYVLSMAYLDFAPDNDLNHGNSGRTFRSESEEKIPWEWQVNASNSSIKHRAYKALDQLMLLLDASGWTEWTESDQYKEANSVLIKNTNDFDAVFPINKAGQLYYRLVPFMLDFENDRLCAILTETVYTTLKDKAEPTAEEKRQLLLAKKAVAYLSLGKAVKTFPVEMMPEGLHYTENTSQKGKARGEVMQFLNAEGEKYLLKLQAETDINNQTYETIDPLMGLDEDTKHVSL